MSKGHEVIKIIQFWILKLKYFEDLYKWIRLYHLVISEWDKNLIAKAFNILEEENTKYTILMTIDAYKIGINNLDVRLAIQ